jgi:hypothetical protein
VQNSGVGDWRTGRLGAPRPWSDGYDEGFGAQTTRLHSLPFPLLPHGHIYHTMIEELNMIAFIVLMQLTVSN